MPDLPTPADMPGANGRRAASVIPIGRHQYIRALALAAAVHFYASDPDSAEEDALDLAITWAEWIRSGLNPHDIPEGDPS